MNILIISPSLYPDRIGGGEILTYNFIQYLKKKHNISVLTNSSNNIDNVNMYRIKRIISAKLSYLFRLMYVLFMEKDKNDVIFVPHTDPSHWLTWILFPIFKKIFSIKYVVILYSGREINWKFPFPYKFFFRNASYVLALCKEVKDIYGKISKANVLKIQQSCDSFINIHYQNIETTRKQYNVNLESNIILFFSRFNPVKSPITIIEAIDQLGEAFILKNKLEFWFCGAGTELATLEQSIKSKPHIENYVKIWGLVSEKDKSAIYKMSDIFIQPSLSEGSPPITLEEAMINGIPSISSNIKQISEQLTDKENILLFKKGNSKDLANKIKYLIENPKKAKELGMSGKKLYDNLASKSSMFHDIEKYLEKVAKKV